MNMIEMINEYNIFLDNAKRFIEKQKNRKVKPAPHVHPLKYLKNVEWLKNTLDNKVKKLNDLKEMTTSDPKLFEFYSKLSPFSQQHFYNNDQIIILNNIIALIEQFLINKAEDAKRYINNGGCCFMGAGIDVYHRDSPQRKKNAVLKRVYSLGYGYGMGQIPNCGIYATF
jgi:hypothetical protein